MKLKNIVAVLAGSAALIVSASAADMLGNFSDADRAFIAKVSQGGMYEVELGQLAQAVGTTQDIRDSGSTETHDHRLVGDRLKAIVEANGGALPRELNPEFQARLERLRELPPYRFGDAYLEDMKRIHEADGNAFAEESEAGSNPDLKAFAAETYRIVQRHLGELKAKVM